MSDFTPEWVIEQKKKQLEIDLINAQHRRDERKDKINKERMEKIKDILLPIFIFTLILSGVSLVIGLIDHVQTEGGCKYESVADYSPSRIITCEFLRKRWKYEK